MSASQPPRRHQRRRRCPAINSMGRGKAGSGPGAGRKRAAAGSVRPGPPTRKRPGLRHHSGAPAHEIPAPTSRTDGHSRPPPTPERHGRVSTPGGQTLPRPGRRDAHTPPAVGGTGVDVPLATRGVSVTPPAPPGRIALPGGQPPPSARNNAFPALLLGASGVGLPLATPVVSSTPPAPPGRTAALNGQPFQMVGRRDGLPASPPGSSGVSVPLPTRGVSPTPDVSPTPPALPGRDAALGGQPLQPAGRRDARPAPAVSGTGNGVSP